MQITRQEFAIALVAREVSEERYLCQNEVDLIAWRAPVSRLRSVFLKFLT